MNRLHNSDQQNQSPGQQPDATKLTTPPTPPDAPREEQIPPQSAQAEEQDPGSITVFRTGNFFVHAFAPLQQTGMHPRSDGNTSVIERIRWLSAEQQRLAVAQTRLLPQVEANTTALRQGITIPLWLEMLLVVLVLSVPIALQTLNVFNYPTYTTDEGYYMANAWAILHGKIEPYTYAYDHPPLGWLQIATWIKLTGGLATFTNAINSGRVLMLALAGASALLLYLITSRLTRSHSAALLAAFIYTISPLSLFYHRQVLLDNIGTFWLLLSLCLVTTGKSQLRTFVFAAVALGIAILSKETLLLFIPVMLYAVWLYASPFQRKFSLVPFMSVTLGIVSTYVLLALLQGEFFPAGTLLGGKGPHASLISTFLQQWRLPYANGQFIESWNTWTQFDKYLLLGGTIAMFINILGGTVNRFQLLAALFVAIFWIFLLSTNVVYPFYIVPMVPFLAINIAVALHTPLRWLTGKIGFDLARALLLLILIGALIPFSIQRAQPLLTNNTTQPQQQAMLWIRDNVPHDTFVITNSYMFSDMREPGGMGVGNGKPFSHAQIYTSVPLDPDVLYKELKGNWQNINFLVVDASMLKDIRANQQYALLNQALHHGVLKAQFGSSSNGSQIQIYQVIRE
jgi:4-amino-4-deoxy-L-arabinose transferase-like glycosyltransferase